MSVTKAIIPAAGFGKRMLPLNKSIPKELLPIAGKPVIQYVVEEAISSGITDILIIISKEKEMIRSFFMNDRPTKRARINFAEQKEMKGLGDAILCGKNFAGNDPVAILLGDNILKSNTDKAVLRQLIEKHWIYQTSIVGVQKVSYSMINRYGVLDGEITSDQKVFRVRNWVEKPNANKAPSNLAVAGVYVFTPDIFQILESTLPGKNGEVQVTDAMDTLAKRQPMYAYQYDGARYDIGNIEDYHRTNKVLS